MRCTKNTFKETVWELLGRDCWGEKWGMREGREADGLLHCEHTETGRKAWKKCSNSLYKWHPERLVSPREKLIPQLGLCGESLTPTYTVNGKVTFEKWGPHRDLIHWLTPGRGAFPPGEAVWFRLRLHFGLDLLSFSFLTFTQSHAHKHTLGQILFQFHHGMR